MIAGERTPWYPPHIKPVRVGVYQIGEGGKPLAFAYWDGSCFYHSAWTVYYYSEEDAVKRAVQHAHLNRRCPWLAKQKFQWRGLTQPGE